MSKTELNESESHTPLSPEPPNQHTNQSPALVKPQENILKHQLQQSSSNNHTILLYGVVIETFIAEAPPEISVMKGDLVQLLSNPSPGKWTFVYHLTTGTSGYIPTNYYYTISANKVIELLLPHYSKTNRTNSDRINTELPYSTSSSSISTSSSSNTSSNSSSSSSSSSSRSSSPEKQSLYPPTPEMMPPHLSMPSVLNQQTFLTSLDASPTFSTNLPIISPYFNYPQSHWLFSNKSNSLSPNRTDPDGLSSNDSFPLINCTNNNTPRKSSISSISNIIHNQKPNVISPLATNSQSQNCKIYGNLEPTDFEVSLIQNCCQTHAANQNDTVNSEETASNISSIPYNFEAPRRLFIINNEHFHSIIELEEDLKKLTFL